MMNLSLRAALFGAAIAQLCSLTPAQASDSDYGQLTTFEVFASGVVLVTTNGPRSPAPACQATRADIAGRWGLDASTPGGQTMLSVLVSAHAQRKRIRIVGTGTCQTWYDSENISYVQVEPQS